MIHQAEIVAQRIVINDYRRKLESAELKLQKLSELLREPVKGAQAREEYRKVMSQRMIGNWPISLKSEDENVIEAGKVIDLL